jgi:hypothetical protein
MIDPIAEILADGRGVAFESLPEWKDVLGRAKEDELFTKPPPTR